MENVFLEYYCVRTEVCSVLGQSGWRREVVSRRAIRCLSYAVTQRVVIELVCRCVHRAVTWVSSADSSQHPSNFMFKQLKSLWHSGGDGTRFEFGRLKRTLHHVRVFFVRVVQINCRSNVGVSCIAYLIRQPDSLTLWSRSSSKCYLRIQSVPQREHHTSPLQRSTG
jgi:hypothetical protein